MRFWTTVQDTTGIAALKKVLEMKKIEIDYFGPRDTKFEVSLLEEGPVIPTHWVEHVPGGQAPELPSPRLMPRANDQTRAGFRMVGGRIRLF